MWEDNIVCFFTAKRIILSGESTVNYWIGSSIYTFYPEIPHDENKAFQ